MEGQRWKSNQELKDGRDAFCNGIETGREQQGIQCRACPGAGVQLCLAILCTINLTKKRLLEKYWVC